jgi:hypothetical protein
MKWWELSHSLFSAAWQAAHAVLPVYALVVGGSKAAGLQHSITTMAETPNRPMRKKISFLKKKTVVACRRLRANYRIEMIFRTD